MVYILLTDVENILQTEDTLFFSKISNNVKQFYSISIEKLDIQYNEYLRSNNKIFDPASIKIEKNSTFLLKKLNVYAKKKDINEIYISTNGIWIIAKVVNADLISNTLKIFIIPENLEIIVTIPPLNQKPKQYYLYNTNNIEKIQLEHFEISKHKKDTFFFFYQNSLYDCNIITKAVSIIVTLDLEIGCFCFTNNQSTIIFGTRQGIILFYDKKSDVVIKSIKSISNVIKKIFVNDIETSLLIFVPSNLCVNYTIMKKRKCIRLH